MSNSIDIRVSGTFEIKVFVFVVINKVLNIMNIFVDLKTKVFTLQKAKHVSFFANFTYFRTALNI